MGTNYYAVKKKPTIANALHIGKSSAGWKFLFHEVDKGMCDYDCDLELHTYEQWEDYLKEHVKNEDIVILNEYDEEVSVQILLDLIKEKQKERKDDYSKNVNGYRFTNSDFS